MNTIDSKLKENYIFHSIYQLSYLIIPIITLPYISRTIEADGVGRYAFAYSVAYYFNALVKMGLNNYGSRTIAYVKEDNRNLSCTFWEIYLFQAFWGIIIFGVYLVYCFFVAKDTKLALVMSFYVFSAIIDITWFLNGLELFKLTSIRDIIIKIISMICIFFLVKEKNDVWIYTLIFSFGMFLSQLIVLPAIFNRVVLCRVKLSGVARHIKPNMLLFIPIVAISIYRTIDKVMLGIMTTSEEVGFYHSAENIIKIPMALIMALGTVMLPRMSSIISKGEKDEIISDTFSKSMMFAMFVSSSICFGIMTVANEFVPIFFGRGFDKCRLLFNILLPGCLFEAFASVIRTQYLIPRKKDKMYLISIISGVFINLIANYFLIPRIQSKGAAIGTFMAYAMVCVVQAAFVYKEANIGRNIVNSLSFIISGILMFVVFRGYRPPIQNDIIALLVKIIISGSFYMAVLGIIIFAKKRICELPR